MSTVLAKDKDRSAGSRAPVWLISHWDTTARAWRFRIWVSQGLRHNCCFFIVLKSCHFLRQTGVLIDTNHFFHQGAFFVVLFCSGDTSLQVLFGSSWPWIGRNPETATSQVLGSYGYTMFLVKTTFKDLYTVHANHSYLSDIPVCLSLPSNLSLPFADIHLLCPGYQKIIFILKIAFPLM